MLKSRAPAADKGTFLHPEIPSAMILEVGMKVLAVHRRLFEGDHERFFVGVVDGFENGIARVTGYSWMRDPYQLTFVRKEDVRTKIISLTSGTVLLYQLASTVDLEALTLQCDPSGATLTLTDGRDFSMDLSERTPMREVRRSG